MITIKDIAKAANVSIATVSMVLNKKDGISTKTREKVLKIAEQLNYVPSASAQALKTKRSHTLGIIIGQLSNSYSTDIIAAAEEVARQYGYDIFICNAELSVENTIQCLRAFSRRDVDGILVSVSVNPEQAYIDELHRLMDRGTQIVSLTRNLEGCGIPIVAFKDDDQVCQSITRLIALGHKQIAMLTAPKESWMNQHRPSMFKRVVQEYGVYNEDYIIHSEIDMYKAKENAIDLLTRHPEITAIYGINDMMALGILQAADQLGIKVPSELSIIGSDGIPYVNFTTPNLTTIMTPRYEIGKRGTKKIIDMIEGRDKDYEEFIVVPCTCLEGGSVSHPKPEK